MVWLLSMLSMAEYMTMTLKDFQQDGAAYGSFTALLFSVCNVFVCLLSHGGGTCFYINERWCTDVTVLKKMCCSDLETFFINSKPFYSPREIWSFILVSVYIPPQANVSSALQKLNDLITDTEQKHPDSVLIILEDFN